MAKYRLHIYFALIMIIYLIVRFIRPSVENEFVKYYLTDILFVPAMGIFALIGVRLIKRDSLITIPIWMIVLLIVFAAAYFEWYLPSTHHPLGWYVSDKMDILMYIIGGGIFYILQKSTAIGEVNKKT